MKGCDSVPRPKTKTNSQIKNDYASLNGFINRAINETIKNDNDKEQE